MWALASLRVWALAAGLGAACGASPGSVSPGAMFTRPVAMTDDDVQLLLVPPLVGRPTATSVTLSLVAGADAITCTVELEPEAEPKSIALAAGATGFVLLDGLEEGRSYRYTVRADDGERREEASGAFRTPAPAGRAFSFALFSDTHLPVADPRWFEGPQFAAERGSFQSFYGRVGRKIRRAAESMADDGVDFVVCLGDMLHQAFGFNETFASEGVARLGYLDFRRHLGRLGSEAPFFAVVGNWEGENGWHPADDRAAAQHARMQLLCNPTPETNRFGGGAAEDYYAWEWGDAFFCVLNVMGYTSTRHTMYPDDDGTAEDWTLGKEQLAWFERTLAATDQPYKLVLMHHVVGGRAGDEPNSAYGRGGGRAAKVGEQARVHELMLRHGVQALFYGHDHVFTDLVVDGIHYTLPGSAGAPWKFVTAETGYERYDERSGYAVVDVNAERARVEFRDLDGEVFEHFEVAPAAEPPKRE